VDLATQGTSFLVIPSAQLVLDFTIQERLSIVGYKIGMWQKVGVLALIAGF
jgi:hypothetical protein